MNLNVITSLHPEVVHFMSIPWCAEHLLRSTWTVAQLSENRTVLHTRENQLVGGTLKTRDTISAWLVFYQRPRHPIVKIDVFYTLITFNEGLIGFPGTVHGGILALVMDEVAGQHIVAERPLGTEPEKSYKTAYLNTTFLAPAQAPGTVLVQSKIIKVEGRKHFVLVMVEDGNGEVITRAEILYISNKIRL